MDIVCLSGREQRVQINGKKSNWDTVDGGVPLGSLLGSLFFIIYINYLDSGISSNISQLAEREAMVLLGELNTMHEWTVKWQMDFNINKCSTSRR